MPQRFTEPFRSTYPLSGPSRFWCSVAVAFLAGISSGCSESGSTTVNEADDGLTTRPATSSDQSVTNSVGMELVPIPAGSFQMGTSAAAIDVRADETPRRQVAITRSFYLGRYEVTQAEYEQVFPGRKSFFRWPDGGGKDRVTQMETAKFPAELV